MGRRCRSSPPAPSRPAHRSARARLRPVRDRQLRRHHRRRRRGRDAQARRRVRRRPARERGRDHRTPAPRSRVRTDRDHDRGDGRDGGVRPAQPHLRRHRRPRLPRPVPAARQLGHPRRTAQPHHRRDPRSSARLLTVPGWQSMAPTLAAHAVQGNAVAGLLHALLGRRALPVVAALTGGSAACAADLVPPRTRRRSRSSSQTGDRRRHDHRPHPRPPAGDHLDRGRPHRPELRRRPPDPAGHHHRAGPLFGRIGISDINRHCTGQIAGAGTESSHWIHGGGQAVDFYSLGGTPTTGADANAHPPHHAPSTPSCPPAPASGKPNAAPPTATARTLTHLTDVRRHLQPPPRRRRLHHRRPHRRQPHQRVCPPITTLR